MATRTARMTRAQLQAKLDELNETAMEYWPSMGLPLRACSANANGTVNSGITMGGSYFFRKWAIGWQTSALVIEEYKG